MDFQVLKLKLASKQTEIFLLLLILGFSLFLRIYFPYPAVFSEPIKYAADDGVYHMRLVENMLLGGHFPHRLYFDAFTYFPYGTYIHFAPLYDWLLSAIIWLVSLGQPTLDLINTIAPFYPAVLGTLAVLVVYFIGKELWNKWAGLLSAFLISVSPPFLFRSLLGATDHHQAEVLFSSLAILFLILAFKNGQNSDRKKCFWFYTILAGISLGLYFLVWNGALLFLFIIFLSIILYYFIEYFSNRNQNWILQAGVLIFLIVLLMIIPYLGHPDIFHAALYDIRHLGSLILGIFSFLFLWWFSDFCRKKKINHSQFVIILIISILLLILLFQSIFPLAFQKILSTFKAVNIGMVPHDLARDMVAEMAPLGIGGAFNAFGGYLFLALIAFGLIIYNFLKEKNKKPENFLTIVWFVVIFLMTGIFSPIGQNRFAYYLSANIALFSSYLIIEAIKFIESIIQCAVKEPEYKKKMFLSIDSGGLIFSLAVFVFYPFPFNLVYPFPINIPKVFLDAFNTAKNGAASRPEDYYETLKWLKENAPDPGVDYYAFYGEPEFEPATNGIQPYNYPDSAYGVMSSWDLGHMITYYSHRIPNANPFQEGLGRITDETVLPGEATFFIEPDENKAVAYLNELKTKYVISDYGGAVGFGAFAGKVEWAQDDTKNYYLQEGENKGATTRYYDKSIAVRLHLFDGRDWYKKDEDGNNIEESYVEHLNHFRLVYESKTTAAAGYFDNPQKDDVKLVKIFELVKGAKIKGKAPENTIVEIAASITTNQGRKFTYKQITTSKNGQFEFIVPYSTYGKDGWLENSTKFEVFASPYIIKIGNHEKTLNVSEKSILEGEVINL